MAEYIEREALKKNIREKANPDGCTHITLQDVYSTVLTVVECELAADVAEVRHGKWIDDGDCYYCSHCNAAYDFLDVATIEGFHFTRLTADYNYCPNCGAKMGDDEE